MKKFFLVVISGILLFLFGVSVAFRIALPTEKKGHIEKYFVYIVDDDGTDYSLELDDNRNFNLTVSKKENSFDSKTEQNNYDIQLQEKEYSIVKKVIDYFKDNYKVSNKKEYDFYFDYEYYKDRIYPDDKELLIELIDALENVALGNEKAGELTKKEIGMQKLEEIENEL